MKTLWRAAYSGVLLPALWVLVRVAAWGSPKLRATLRGGRGLWTRVEAQLAARNPGQPLVWFHVASAGEFLQAEPLLEIFLKAGYQAAVTVTSVTGYTWGTGARAAHPGWVVLDYLPFDTRANARRMLALLRPRALVFVKYDLWPNLVWEAEGAGVPQFLVSATLHPRSRRYTSPLGRSLHRTLYAGLAAILAASEGDRERFLATCPGHPGVLTLGDTRFDSVLARRESVRPPPLPKGLAARPTFVFGSVWPADEAVVLPALAEALAQFPELVALIVPHEVHQPHLRAIEAALAGFAPVRFSALDPGTAPPPRVVVVDSVGMLAGLYRHGTVAYVGGGFSTGVHNVAEPLALGLPTLFGPRHLNSPEAVEFREQGFCFAVATAAELKTVLFDLLADPARCKEIGAAAARAVEAKGGASRRCFERIETELEKGAG